MKRTIQALAALLLVGCASQSYNAPYVALEPPSGMQRVRHVEGNDCSFAAFSGTTRDISVRHAMENALEGTGATGIVNARIYTGNGPGVLELCFFVEGEAVR